MALRNPRRRCLHDYAFASEVILHPDVDDPLHPRSRLERIRQRLQQFTEDRESAWEAEKKKYAFVPALWKWLLQVTKISMDRLLFVRDRWHTLVQGLAAHALPTTSAPAAKALAAGKLTALVATTTVTTGTAVVVATTAYLSAPIVGNWNGIHVTRIGLQSYQATAPYDFAAPGTGCPVTKGQVIARMSGHGQHYAGYEEYSYRRGQDCGNAWAPATVDLIGTNTLKLCDKVPGHAQGCVFAKREPGR